MTLTRQTIFVISKDMAVIQGLINELAPAGCCSQMRVVDSFEGARGEFRRTLPSVVFLDESAIDSRNGETLESVLAQLTESAPVVVAAASDKEGCVAFLIASGAVDFVSRTGYFVAVAAGRIAYRARIAVRLSGIVEFPKDGMDSDFGEILRHEVNNPLTGILGNTELLLARRDRFPPAAVERLQTIAKLAVRLRETVRQLSNAWEERHENHTIRQTRKGYLSTSEQDIFPLE